MNIFTIKLIKISRKAGVDLDSVFLMNDINWRNSGNVTRF